MEVVKLLKDGDRGISSTNIRSLIENGFIRRANYELGSIYGFYANIVSGAGRGKAVSCRRARRGRGRQDRVSRRPDRPAAGRRRRRRRGRLVTR